jgi:hypothetical protein
MVSLNGPFQENSNKSEFHNSNKTLKSLFEDLLTDINTLVPVFIHLKVPHMEGQPEKTIAQARRVIYSELEQLLVTDEEPTMVGNQEGFDVFRLLKSLQSQVDAQEEELKTQKEESKILKGELRAQKKESNNVNKNFIALHRAKIRNSENELIKSNKNKILYEVNW